MASKLRFLWVFWVFMATALWPGTAYADGWTVVAEESEIRFTGNQTGNPFEGRFETFTVQIDYDVGQPEKAFVRAVIDTGSAKTGDTQRDEAMPGKDWFFASMFPSATFTANGFAAHGDNQFSTNGTLEIKGVQKNLEMPFSLSIDGNRATMTSTVSLNRQDFGVGVGPWAEGKWVGLDVEVAIKLVAVRKGS